MRLDYIIVQAGGKGTRMEALTRNKPKALVPVDNLPMIFHLFRQFSDKRFIVIGDYQYDVLKRYLAAFGGEYDIRLVCATGKAGTCAGLSEALSYIPEDERFMLIWCDLVLPEDYEIPDTENNVIGLSRDFPCRWSYEHGEFKEERTVTCGVAGHFIFKDKSVLANVPEEGEFVRYLKDQQIAFCEQSLYRTHEYGLYSEWNKLPASRCRPFNSIEMTEDTVKKVPKDEQGLKLARHEIKWYEKIIGGGGIRTGYLRYTRMNRFAWSESRVRTSMRCQIVPWRESVRF